MIHNNVLSSELYFMITNIENEKRYHTIVVMRTKDTKLAMNFPHTIFTKNNKMVYLPEEK
jgi:hypothetical protein